ncbi:MAG: helix-turn-helix transcriptional regulator [Pseudomonadota bacterium]
MDKDILERIQERLEALGITSRAASMEAGLNAHFLQKLFAGKTEDMTTAKLIKLAGVLETSPEWLLTGRGASDTTAEVIEFIDLLENKLSERDRDEIYEIGRLKARRRAAEADAPEFKGEDAKR